MTEPTSRPTKAVLIGVPAYRWIEVATARFIAELCCYTAYARKDIVVGIQMLDRFPAAGCKHCYQEGSKYEDARNLLVKKALDAQFTHLCMIDADMDRSMRQKGSHKMLESLLDAERDVIAPLFMRRSHPFDLLARRWDKLTRRRTPIDSKEAMSGKILDDIDEVGTGMILIDCRVLREMSHPWFAFEVRDGEQISEDVNFCRKVRQKGYKISVHTGWHLDHIGEHRYTPMEAIEMQELTANKEGQLALDELHKELIPEVA